MMEPVRGAGIWAGKQIRQQIDYGVVDYHAFESHRFESATVNAGVVAATADFTHFLNVGRIDINVELLARDGKVQVRI